MDKNNLAPRLGIVYALREGNRPTILRFGAGIYNDQPLLAIYQRALLNNGSGRFLNFSFNGSNNGTTTPSLNAPAFPAIFPALCPPVRLLRRKTLMRLRPIL